MTGIPVMFSAKVNDGLFAVKLLHVIRDLIFLRESMDSFISDFVIGIIGRSTFNIEYRNCKKDALGE